jgi:hypothetical protein
MPSKNPKSTVKPKAAAKPAATKKSSVPKIGESLTLAGKKAPAFTLADQDGNPVTLASMTARGPVVL